MKAILITAVALTLLGTASASRAEVKEVSFLHTTKTKYVLKLDCDEERTGTAPPVYTCYNKNGNEQRITPGPDWQMVELSRACLLNTVTDTVDSSCAGVAIPGKEPMLYIYQKDKKFFQASKYWKPLPVDDARCGSRKIDVVVLIRGDSSVVRPSQIEWSKENAREK